MRGTMGLVWTPEFSHHLIDLGRIGQAWLYLRDINQSDNRWLWLIHKDSRE